MQYYTTEVPKIISKEFDDEVVLANYDSGLYYSLADTGAKIWLALRAGASDEGIITAFAGKFPAAADVEASVRAFIEHLVREGLIVPADSGDEKAGLSLDLLHEFQAPVLDRFDDLKELLLLDPVHDVDETGWPVKADDVR